MSGDDWMHEQEQGVMATEETYPSGGDDSLSRTDELLFVGSAILSFAIGALSAMEIVYGTFWPAVTVSAVLRVPVALLVCIVASLVWFLLFAAVIDHVTAAYYWLSRGEREE